MPDELLIPKEKNVTEKGALYLVGTPIGNMADITERAVKVLGDADFVAAEDTRNSGLMLSRLGLRRPLVPYHEHNKVTKGPEIVERMRAGETCALVTDAGMPAISDPGEDLVRLCAEAGIPVHPVPGACAAVSALAVSALPTNHFIFEGFLPALGKERRERLAYVSSLPDTCILYEAPHRLRKTLADLREACGDDRPVALCRELTKLNEDVTRITLGEACRKYEETEPRGEFVLILGAKPASPAANEDGAPLTVRERVDAYLAQGLSEKDAIKAAAKDLGVPKNDVYSEIKKK